MLVTLNVWFTGVKNRLPNTQTTLLILQLTEFIPEHNYFRYQDRYYLQRKGTPMGTLMATHYASVFMAHLEENILKKSTQ